MTELVLLGGFWIACMIGAAIVATNRGADTAFGIVLGFLFGPVGLAVTFALSSDRKCTQCREAVRAEATRCPHCRADVPAPPAPAVRR